jgi:hypothetical protein
VSVKRPVFAYQFGKQIRMRFAIAFLLLLTCAKNHGQPDEEADALATKRAAQRVRNSELEAESEAEPASEPSKDVLGNCLESDETGCTKWADNPSEGEASGDSGSGGGDGGEGDHNITTTANTTTTTTVSPAPTIAPSGSDGGDRNANLDGQGPPEEASGEGGSEDSILDHDDHHTDPEPEVHALPDLAALVAPASIWDIMLNKIDEQFAAEGEMVIQTVREVLEQDSPALQIVYSDEQSLREALESNLAKAVDRDLGAEETEVVTSTTLVLWLQATQRLRDRVNSKILKSILAKDAKVNVRSQAYALKVVYFAMLVNCFYLALSLAAWFKDWRRDARLKATRKAAKVNAAAEMEVEYHRLRADEVQTKLLLQANACGHSDPAFTVNLNQTGLANQFPSGAGRMVGRMQGGHISELPADLSASQVQRLAAQQYVMVPSTDVMPRLTGQPIPQAAEVHRQQ